MDILMIYWNSIWNQAVAETEPQPRQYTAEDLAAFARRRRRAVITQPVLPRVAPQA